MKVNDKRGPREEQTGSSIELELAILHQEVLEKLKFVNELASFKIFVLVLSKAISNARGPIPPADLLTMFKENLDKLVVIEKKMHDKTDQKD